MNVVENPEFRKLILLLREDIEDKDIPHRTKLCQLILDQFRTYFASLKEELAVRILLFALCIY